MPGAEVLSAASVVSLTQGYGGICVTMAFSAYVYVCVDVLIEDFSCHQSACRREAAAGATRPLIEVVAESGLETRRRRRERHGKASQMGPLCMCIVPVQSTVVTMLQVGAPGCGVSRFSLVTAGEQESSNFEPHSDVNSTRLDDGDEKDGLLLLFLLFFRLLGANS